MEKLYSLIDSYYDSMVATLEKMVNIDSGADCPEGIKAVAEIVGNALKALNFDVEYLDYPGIATHVLAKRKGSAPDAKDVMIIGHMDTVFPKGTAAARPFRAENGIAYGPGVLDMKSGVTIALYALKALDSLDLMKNNVTVMFVGDEEAGHPYTDAADKLKEVAKGKDAVFNMETGSDKGTVVLGRTGIYYPEITVEGIAAHSGKDPEKGASAVKELVYKLVDLYNFSDTDDDISFNAGIISGGVAEFEIPALNASDYPSLPVTGADNTMTVKCGMLREMIEKTIYAVSQDDKKPAHTGELFVIEPGSLTIVALDGYRLAIIQRDGECTRDIRIIIPAKTLQELLKIMGGADDDVKIDANRRYVVFTSNGYTIMSRLIEGDFLNYESVIPKDRKTRVTVECKNFIDTIERASLIITERLKNPLRISFAEDRVTVRCQTPLGKVVDEFAPVSMEGDAVEIGFNNRYLLDALRFSKCEKMVLEINGPLSPVKLLPEDGKDFIYLVLPVRFKNEG